MDGATTRGRAGRMAVVVLALAAAAPAQQAGEEPDLEALLARYEELRERTRDLIEQAERAEARNRELREELARARAQLERLTAATQRARAKLEELAGLVAGIDDAWLRHLAARDLLLADPPAWPWAPDARDREYPIAVEVEALVRTEDTATATVRETVRAGGELVERRRTVVYERRAPVWVRRASAVEFLRRAPAPPWVLVEAVVADDGSVVVRVGDRAWPQQEGAAVDPGVGAALRERVRAWSEAGVSRADIPAWVEAAPTVPAGVVTALLAVLREAGAEAPDLLGRG